MARQQSSELVRALLSLEGERRITGDQLFPIIEGALARAAENSLRLGAGSVVCHIDRAAETVAFAGRSADGNETALDLRVEQLRRVDVQLAYQEMQRRLQGLEEEQRLATWRQYVGEIVPGTLRRGGRGQLVVEIGNSTVGITEAAFPPSEQIYDERYAQGRVMDFLVKGFTSEYPVNVLVSRRDTEFVVKLLKEQVHELSAGDIEVRAIAREAGLRTKIAVALARTDLRLDPVAACVGSRGTRINALRGRVQDAIDVFAWRDEPAERVREALGVKGIADIEIDAPAKTATVWLDEAIEPNAQAKAIGKNGHNVRLANAISGFDIKIRNVTERHAAELVADAS